MVRYICEKCNKIFAAKIDYTRHINRKKPCDTNRDLQMYISKHNDTVLIPQDTEKKQNELICNYCLKVFSCVSALYRHVRLNCNMKKQEDMCQQLKENEELKNKLKENEKKTTIDLSNDLDDCIDCENELDIYIDDNKIIQNNVDEIESESSNKLVTFSENNDIIFSGEQKEYIIRRFPKNLHEYLNKVNNPLDETQVIVSLLHDKNIKTVLTHEENMFGMYEWKGNYHVTDLANHLKYSDPSNWSRRLNINFKKFNEIVPGDLVRQFDGPNYPRYILNFNDKKVDTNALFTDDEGLKIILLKTTKKGKEIEMFKEWIIKYTTIAKSIITMIIQVKNEYEKEQQKYEIEKYKQQVKQIEEKRQKDIYEMKKRIEKAIEVYPVIPKQKGYVYIVQSEFLKTKGLVRIGRTLNIEKREGQYKCSDPSYNVEYYRDVEDRIITEKTLHYVLSNIRKYSNKEFFYCSSIDETKEIVNMNINIIEETIGKQDGIMKKIRNEYVKGKITEMEEENEEKIKRERSRSKSPSANIR